jgi:hypothetical protein
VTTRCGLQIALCRDDRRPWADPWYAEVREARSGDLVHRTDNYPSRAGAADAAYEWASERVAPPEGEEP